MSHSMDKKMLEKYLPYFDDNQMEVLDALYVNRGKAQDYKKKSIFISVPKTKEVIIMRGLPGSGKSTYVKENFDDAVVCSADTFFLDREDNYVFVPHKISEAHQDCWGHFIRSLFDKEERIVVDNTNMCKWEYANYIRLAEEMGYRVQIICMASGLHDETTVAELVLRNTHGVGGEAIARMKDRYEPDYREEIV